MSRAEKIFARVDRARAKLNLPPVRGEAGFDYSTTIRRLQDEQGYSDRALASCIGCTHVQLANYRDRGAIPNHIYGEMLCVLWEDHYPRIDQVTGKKSLPMSKEQEDGGVRVASRPRGRVNRL